MRLQLAKLRADELEDGVAEGYTPEDWHLYNERLLLPLILQIGRICRNGHVELTVESTTPEVVITPPPLLGTPKRRRPAGPPLPSGWRDYLPPAEPEIQP